MSNRQTFLMQYTKVLFEQARNKFKKGWKDAPDLIFKGEINDDAIKYAVKKAFPDITFRTMKKKDNVSGKKNEEMIEELFIVGFGERIKDWLTHAENFNFSDWHADVCG